MFDQIRCRGLAAQHQAQQLMPTVTSIQVTGGVPQAVAGGSWLETHAKPGG